MPIKIIRNQENNLFVFAQMNAVTALVSKNKRYNNETDMSKSTDVITS